MAECIGVPDRAFPKQAGRVPKGIQPRQERDRVVLREAELIRGMVTNSHTGADPAPQTERRSKTCVKPVDVLSAGRHELHPKPLVPVVGPTRRVSPHLVDDAAITVEETANKIG